MMLNFRNYINVRTMVFQDPESDLKVTFVLFHISKGIMALKVPNYSKFYKYKLLYRKDHEYLFFPHFMCHNFN